MRDLSSDEALLGAYVASRDEKAFRQLAERHSGLIYHSALRILDDKSLAEDVTQRVLEALARKASGLTGGTFPLPAWLHRAAVLEAKAARRAESRHQRKKHAFLHGPRETEVSGDPSWRDAIPHLDEAIGKLSAADRQVLLLHFVDGMTFPEIAGRIGKSAAAVQKQSRRALETLQRLLARRGVALSLGVVTAGLTAEMAKAAPAIPFSLPATLPAAGKTATSIFVMKKTTLATVGVTLVLCGIPLARQRATIDRLQTELRTMETTPEQTSPSASRKNATQSVSLLKRLASDLQAQDYDIFRYLSAIDHLESLSDEALAALVTETFASGLPHWNREVVLARVYQMLNGRDPLLALDTAAQVPLDFIRASNATKSALWYGLRPLSEKDGRRALEWFHAHLETLRTIANPAGNFSENELRMMLAYGLIFSSPQDAVEVLRPLPARILLSDLDQLVRSAEPSLRKDLSGFVRVVRELLPEAEAHDAITALTEVHFDSDRYRSTDLLLEKCEVTPRELDTIIRKAGAWPLLQAAKQNPDKLDKAITKYKTWLGTHQVTTGLDRRVGLSLGQSETLWREGEAVAKALESFPQMGLGDEVIIGFLEVAGAQLDPQQAGRLMSSLADPEAGRKFLPKPESDQ